MVPYIRIRRNKIFQPLKKLLQQLAHIVTFLLITRGQCSTMDKRVGDEARVQHRAFTFFWVFYDFSPNFECKLPASANFRDRGLFIS